MEKLDLTQTTFIIPLCIESEDRRKNTEITLSYLCKYLNTNIIIYEYDTESKLKPILDKIDFGKTKIDHWFIENKTGNKIFHRTRFLNEMIMASRTPVVVNYDIDVIFTPKCYEKCQEFILGGHDLVYPYFWGNSQYQVFKSGRSKLEKTLDLNSLDLKIECNLTRSEYGHAQFFKRSAYLEGGLEQEEMISYGPEDAERGLRFQKLGYVVVWSNFFVFHIEHSRTLNSSQQNPHFKHNVELFEKLKAMSKEELRLYYDNVEYMKKYRNA